MYSPYKAALKPVYQMVSDYAAIGTVLKFTGGEGPLAAVSPLAYANHGLPGFSMVNHPGNASTDLRASGANAFMLVDPSLIL